MNIGVDANIVFSAVLNSSGKIGDLLMNPNNVFNFFGCDFLKEALNEYQTWILNTDEMLDLRITLQA